MRARAGTLLPLMLAGLLAACTPSLTAMSTNAPEAPSAQAATGQLWVRVRWPQQDLPGFKAQTIPYRTTSVRFSVFNGAGQSAGTRVVARAAGPTEASASFTLPVGTGYRLVAEAIAAEGLIAQGDATNLTIARAKALSVPVTLNALYAPTITQFLPVYGPPGTLVRITGARFGASQLWSWAVNFGGATASATRSSDTELVARVPEAADGRQVNLQVVVDGVPSTSVALFIASDAGFDASVVPLSSLDNGLGVGLGGAGAPLGVVDARLGATAGSLSLSPSSGLALELAGKPGTASLPAQQGLGVSLSSATASQAPGGLLIRFQ